MSPTTKAFCAWGELKENSLSGNSDPDLDLVAERNYELCLDMPSPSKKLDYWQQARLKEEEDIRNINFEQYALRQAELESED